ncbi:hypothetical protein ACTXT7_001675 [Hymenolepis weldensis]
MLWTIYTPNGPQAVVVNIWLEKRSSSVFYKSSSTVGTHVNGLELQNQVSENGGWSDGLSRLIENQRAENEETVVAFVSVERDVQHILAESIRNTPVLAEDIRKETEKNVVLQR